MEIVKIVEYDDNESGRMNYEDAKKAAAKAGARLLTANEWLKMPREESNKYSSVTPFWLDGGLLARVFGLGFGYDGGHDVVGVDGLDRFGVLAVKLEKTEPDEKDAKIASLEAENRIQHQVNLDLSNKCDWQGKQMDTFVAKLAEQSDKISDLNKRIEQMHDERKKLVKIAQEHGVHKW